MFAAPNSTTHQLATVVRVSEDVRRLDVPVAGAVIVSAGGIEMSPPAAQRVLAAARDSHLIVNVVERHDLRLERGTPQGGNGGVFEALSARTHAQLVRGAGESVYGFGLEGIQRQLEAESVITYVVPRGAPQSVRVRVKAPAHSVIALPLERTLSHGEDTSVVLSVRSDCR
jgi:hypothetical protein